MLKIGEFSKLGQVSIRMLRYYDEAGLLPPARVDPESAYRLYAPTQLEDLHKITFLRDLGFQVAEIKAALQNWDTTALHTQLAHKEEAIRAAIRAEEEKLQKLRLAAQDLSGERFALHYNVSIKHVPSYPVLSVRRILPDYWAEGPLWKELAAFAEAKHIDAGHTFSIYHDTEYKEQNVDVELCAVVPALGQSEGEFTFRHTEAVGAMASAMVAGSFENIAGAYRSFAAFLEHHPQYTMTGTSRQIVHKGPWNEEDPQNWLTEMQVHLKDAP